MSGQTTRAAPRKVLVINQYYAPDIASSGQLLAELCAGLAANGLSVRVVTGQPSYTEGIGPAPEYESLNGVGVHRVRLPWAHGRERIDRRLVGYLGFMVQARRKANSLARQDPPDIVLTLSNPPVVGLIGARLARRYRARFVYVLYDIYPDLLSATGWVRLPWPVTPLWNRLNRMILDGADTVVVPGDCMRETLASGKGVDRNRIRVVPNWARPEMDLLDPDGGARIREQLGVGRDELLLLYSGNIGIMQPVDAIMDAAAQLQDVPARFVFVGDGARRKHLLERVERERPPNVTVLPFQTEERFRALVAGSDACFVALNSGLERYSVPSRSYTFMSAGRPVIGLMSPDADIARLISEKGCGWNAGDAEGLVTLVQALAHDRDEIARRGRAARQAYDEMFRQERIVRTYSDLLTYGLEHRAGV